LYCKRVSTLLRNHRYNFILAFVRKFLVRVGAGCISEDNTTLPKTTVTEKFPGTQRTNFPKFIHFFPNFLENNPRMFILFKACSQRKQEDTMDCPNREKNLAKCNCTYEPCPRKGICCECIAYHRSRGELPACFFTAEEERTYDRSIKYFVSRRK